MSAAFGTLVPDSEDVAASSAVPSWQCLPQAYRVDLSVLRDSYAVSHDAENVVITLHEIDLMTGWVPEQVDIRLELHPFHPVEAPTTLIPSCSRFQSRSPFVVKSSRDDGWSPIVIDEAWVPTLTLKRWIELVLSAMTTPLRSYQYP